MNKVEAWDADKVEAWIDVVKKDEALTDYYLFKFLTLLNVVDQYGLYVLLNHKIRGK